MSTPVLTAKNLHLSYRRREGLWGTSSKKILQDLSFELLEGETLGIIGNNGAGKSSLLRILAGVISPDRGKVTTATGDDPLLLTLQGGLDMRLTGYDNLVYCGMLNGCGKATITEKASGIIDFSGLGNAVYDPVSTYSSGMRARLMFALAVHLDRSIILIDEMLGVGDEEFRHKSTDAIKQKISAKNSVILVSHNLPFMQNICDRVLWIENRTIKKCGQPEELIGEYREISRVINEERLQRIRSRKPGSKQYNDPAWQSRVAITALKKDLSIDELAELYALDRETILKWQTHLVKHAAELFRMPEFRDNLKFTEPKPVESAPEADKTGQN